MAGELRAATDEVLGAALGFLGVAPSRVYVSPGSPVVDCDQLVCWFELGQVGTFGGTLAGLADPHMPSVNIANLVVERWALACITLPEAAPVDLVEEAADIILEEGWEVWCRLPGALDSASACRFRSMGTFTPSASEGVQGEYAGWRIRLSVEVPGWTS